MRPEDKDRILTELRARFGARWTEGPQLLEVLADSIYHEERRLREDRDSPVYAEDKSFWKKIRGRLNHSTERELQSQLGRVVNHYAQEICGNFDPRVYRVTTRVLPPALGMLLNAVSPGRLMSRLPGAPGIDESIIIQGATEHLRRLHELGTVVVTPTHVSNLDSIIMGFSIFRLGLPPLVYGAGLNLFTNAVIGFFMRNLGAYTVDRRKRDPLYKEVLKEYATLTLENDYDNLFFPGGTRSRSGAVERKLKMGLLGTTIGAYVQNLRRGKANPKVFVVPATLSFQLCLEAETLIDDFLKEVGKSRYIISDDEFSQPKRVFDFFTRLLGLESRIYVTFGRGLDPFGNPVDDDGNSLDPHGRVIDPARYTWVRGEPEILPERDREYTRELAERISDAFGADNVVQSTHIVARAMLDLLRSANPTIEPLRLIRAGGSQEDFELVELYRAVDRLRDELRPVERRNGIRLTETVMHAPPEDIVADALGHFAAYHRRAAAARRGDRVFAADRNLLFYYSNRLEGYRLDRSLGLGPILSEDNRALRSGGRL